MSEHIKEQNYTDSDNLLVYKITQPPPNPPPKPKKKQLSDTGIPSNLDGIIHERGMGSEMEVAK
ncbi:uncharacterized protein Dwil_GK19241 [Drosophila willistoni]|uniref:Uncharacterized protein n=2 Tax=Drosophila willistoni TaxID=7260 RepID=B4N1H0_DROWI|nr:uncharacterized protein Dwil_GK19241 [Drosophila willistoni]